MALTADALLEIPFKTKLALLGVLVVLIIGGYVVGGYMPAREEIDRKDGEINKLTNDKAEKEIIAANLDAFRAEYESLERQLQEAVKMLPNEKEIPELLFSISQLVEGSGLQLDVFEPQGEVPLEFYAQVPVNIDVTGEFKSLAVFLDKVGKLPRIVNMTNLSITTAADVGGAVALKAKGKITTYRFLQTSES